MAKVRVYELAKELGLESKELLAKLQEVGEFVRSASSTVEAPVLRKLMDKFPELKPSEVVEKTPAKKTPAKKAAPKKVAGPTKEEIEAALAQLPEAAREQIVKQQTNPALNEDLKNLPNVPNPLKFHNTVHHSQLQEHRGTWLRAPPCQKCLLS